METAPKKIGKYEIVSPLGKGAMGMVYKAFDPMIRRFVAIKTVDLTFTQPSDDDTVKRFLREAQAAGNLNHPNIVGIYEYGEDAGRAFIAMEFVEGATLVDLLRKKHPFSLTEIHRIMGSVLAALDYSHRMGVIHRDIKPGNIMLNRSGAVKVMDFGIARIESSELTQAGTILGTPGYMSPEQLLGETVDLRSDLYSAGIVLYELLTGERAFTGSSFASVIYKVIHNDLSPPSRLKPAVPGSLDGLVAKACAKKAMDRYQTAVEFSADLDRAVAAQNEAGQFQENASTLSDTLRVDDAPAVSRSPKRGRSWIAVAAVLIVAAGIAAVVLVMRRDRPEPEPIARRMPGEIFRDCDTCPEMVVLPPGRFVQGSSDSDANHQTNEGPVRIVSIDYALAVGRYEITRGEFARFAAESGHQGTGCHTYDGSWESSDARSWQSPGFEQDDTHPATCISWDDAQAYVSWLSGRTGKRYRLLSASEWEYAANAGGGTKGGPPDTCDAANVADRSTEATYPGWDVFDCTDNFVHTAPAGSFQANAFGLYDMLGNVFEWVEDCWHDNYAQAPSDGAAWVGSDCSLRVLRGGSWFTPPEYVRPAFRNRFDTGYRSSSFGFRVARMP